MFSIPILTYHKISDQREFGLTTISQIKFKEHIHLLKTEGYSTISFNDLLKETPLPERPIIVSFDDGYESIYENAFEILLKYGFKAVVFVISDYIGQLNGWEAVSFQQKHRHLAKNQILDLSRHGFEIGSHGKKHKYLPALNDKAVFDEVEGSKKYLQELTGKAIISFCYPYGRCTGRVANIVKEAGYRFATRNISFKNMDNNNSLTLVRRSIYSTDSINAFNEKIINHSIFSKTYFSEFLIQQGALASIGIHVIRDRFVLNR
jgi:peptidoglycan/xylan/chitin deacetylase (PgdA/CDA1 family)